jgi:hypothetical protein
MCFRILNVAFMLAIGVGAAQAQDEARDLKPALQALEELRNGDKTPFDVVDTQGADLLKTFDRPEEQGQIHFTLAHIHAQSGLKFPKTIVTHGQAALDSKLLTPAQRATIYSYLSSAHEVDQDVKDFAERRRKAVAPLLTGLAEMTALELPAVAPELPIVPKLRIDVDGPAEIARVRALQEAFVRARAEAERTRELIWRQQVLKDQVKWMYYREPVADDELRELATKAVGKELAGELVATAQAERARIEKAQAERKAKEAKEAMEE